jgi:hypothetical protein
VKIEEVGEAFERGHCIGHPRQLVVAEVQHPKLLQAANLFGHFRERVIGQHQRLELGLIPHRVGHATQSLLPEVQVR